MKLLCSPPPPWIHLRSSTSCSWQIASRTLSAASTSPRSLEFRRDPSQLPTGSSAGSTPAGPEHSPIACACAEVDGGYAEFGRRGGTRRVDPRGSRAPPALDLRNAEMEGGAAPHGVTSDASRSSKE
eukprot:scaffold299513_cov49-Tisochrysis_lutea.AAC.2